MMQVLDEAPLKKAILFGCTELAQFKDKLLIYDEICRSTRGSKARVHNPSAAQATTPKNQNKIIC